MFNKTHIYKVFVMKIVDLKYLVRSLRGHYRQY